MAEANDLFNGYALKEMIGKGAFGSVWKAIDSKSNSEVAVKVIDRR
jgi:serine/threonine protein kinase